jgi:crotonobetainyl-CoA:carnitine CoA-transferase CaiB-like acyl-CoA transferase
MKMAGPLEGIRVIDFSAVISGPLATMMLADQGAEVIKLESPGLGDITRTPAFARGGLTALYTNCNRGKRSVVLDLHKPRAREIAVELVRGADVFVQNFRPGAAARLGLGADEMLALNPELIYVSISGFGESGPYSDRRVYDPIIQGLTGNVAIQRDPDIGLIDLVRNLVCDKSSAYTAAQAISAALFARERGAGGQHIRIPMLDAALAFFWPDGMLAHTLIGDDVSPGVALYDVYRLTRTADGSLIYFAASASEKQALYRALDRADLCDEARFNAPVLPREDLEELGQILHDEFLKWDTAEITERLVAEQVPVAPALGLEEVFEDPQIRHNGAVSEREHPTAGRIREARPGARFEGTPPERARLAPLAGEHSDEVLAELGLDADERARLRSEGILA